MSQDASDRHSDTKICKIHQNPFKKCNSKESVITEKNVDAVMQDEDEQEESKNREISLSSISSEKKDGSEGLNIREEEDSNEGDDSNDIVVAEEKISHREAEEEDDEAQGGDEEGNEKRDGTEPSDREELEREEDVPEDIPDSGDGGETMEEEERDNSFQNKRETRKTVEGHVEDEREIHNRYIFKFMQISLFLNIHHLFFNMNRLLIALILTFCIVLRSLKRKRFTIKK